MKIVNIFSTLVIIPLVLGAIPFKYLTKIPKYPDYWFQELSYNVVSWAIGYYMSWVWYAFFFALESITGEIASEDPYASEYGEGKELSYEDDYASEGYDGEMKDEMEMEDAPMELEEAPEELAEEPLEEEFWA